MSRSTTEYNHKTAVIMIPEPITKEQGQVLIEAVICMVHNVTAGRNEGSGPYVKVVCLNCDKAMCYRSGLEQQSSEYFCQSPQRPNNEEEKLFTVTKPDNRVACPKCLKKDRVRVAFDGSAWCEPCKYHFTVQPKF